MQPTRRYWAMLCLAGFLAVGAVTLDLPTLLVGAAVICGWLLSRQYRYLRGLRDAVENIEVDRYLSRGTVTTDDAVTVSLAATRPPTPVDLSVTASPPVGSTGGATDARTVRFDSEDASTTFELSFPVAGEFEFGRPVLTATDPLGLLRSQVPVGDTERVTVEPRAPRDMHVGEGGDRIASGIGTRTSERRGSGLEPATVRQYVPGDEVRRIDWNATARLNHTHVREFEAQSDPATMLYVDHRASMATGPAGETKLDYAREVALAFVNSARSLNSRLGLTAVGDEGPTTRYPPHGGTDQYVTVRRTLRNLAPSGERTTAWRTRYDRREPDETRRAAAVLADDHSEFGASLRPFFDARTVSARRTDDAPFLATVRRDSPRLSDSLWAVIVTDDSHPSEVREAVMAARQGGGNVMVFLTPTVLFEPGRLADLDAAYDAYAEFESFRRSLGGLERVSAFEVGPGSKLSAVADARPESRSRVARRGEST
ncbi:DUF58 domain-containing protein [Halostella salina]|uniref:DUF58 domain-containing protein n=1 Tax=Halostella salina TaxID=1547897 RepID=UPI000EF7F2E0|nr:DUF58 domain-containing protein [Halostella salina]